MFMLCMKRAEGGLYTSGYGYENFNTALKTIMIETFACFAKDYEDDNMIHVEYVYVMFCL